LIPAPATDGRLLQALDDSINPKVGQQIFACGTIFDHAAKANQSQYPLGAKPRRGRFAQVGQRALGVPVFGFLLLLRQAYHRRGKGQVVPFQTKRAKAGEMLIGIGQAFSATPLLAVTDSWFGNASLWQPVRQALGSPL